MTDESNGAVPISTPINLRPPLIDFVEYSFMAGESGSAVPVSSSTNPRPASVDVTSQEAVTQRVQTDLNRVVSKGTLRQPASSWTRQKAEQFSLSHIRSTLKADAKHLTQLLHGLIPKQQSESPEADAIPDAIEQGSVAEYSPNLAPLSSPPKKVVLASSVRAMQEPDPNLEASFWQYVGVYEESEVKLLTNDVCFEGSSST
ncbi:hypothetical protein EC991_009687 [Linnemannia zychae]|nr:hypothetical protein EC991_009687 [Linnemannia zychae]